MTHKEKLGGIIKILHDKNIKQLSAFQAINVLKDFYGVKEKTAKEYLREMVAFGFFEKPVEGNCFKVK